MEGHGGGSLDLPGTEEAARTHLALPMGTELSAEQVDEVIAACASGST
jgi:dTDP-4-amino-4,6-dideoxygalactose transaminase